MRANLFASLFLLAVGAAIGGMIWNGSRADVSPGGASGDGLPVLMDFYADWCGPCQAMKPVVHEFAGEMQGRLRVWEVNVDENPDLARQYNVRSIPCFVMTRGGKEVSRRTGSMPKESLRQLSGL